MRLTAPLLPTAAEGGGASGHFPPTPEVFWQPLVIFGTVDVFGSPMTLALTRGMVAMTISVALLSLWLVLVSRRLAMVPTKGQWLTEGIYNFVRNGVARDSIGSAEFMRFVPLLFSLFTLILLNNWFGIIPPIQMPTMARIGFPIALAAVVYVVYHWVGFAKHGFVGYLKSLIPPGVPWWLMPLMVVLEFITYFITRPLTLALRLFGNMFAGHLLLVVFIVGGYELLLQGGFLSLIAVPAWAMAVVMTAFEAGIQFLQAYIFVLLSATYIGAALADEH